MEHTKRDCNKRGYESKVCDSLMTLHFLVTVGLPVESRSERFVHVGRTFAVASGKRNFVGH